MAPITGGPLIEGSKCVAAGRFPPLLRALGEHVRQHFSFFKVCLLMMDFFHKFGFPCCAWNLQQLPEPSLGPMAVLI